MNTVETPSLVRVDPRELVLEGNSRTISDLETEDPQLVDSIRQHGVAQPIMANPDHNGALRVRDGFSRTIAAVLTHTDTVPVVVVDAVGEYEWERLRDQWLFNEHRRGYSPDDKARVMEDLSLFGLTAEQITSELSTTAETVEAGLAVRRSTNAIQTLHHNPQLDMFQAAALAEFDGDDDAVADLQDTLEHEPEQYEHTVARLRHRRQRQQVRAEREQELAAAGVTVLAQRPEPDGTIRALHMLVRSDDDPTPLTDESVTHSDCPGHAAYVTFTWDDKPRDMYACTDWQTHGHAAATPNSSRSQSGRTVEHDKAEMRRVKHHNKEWRAARDVRRDWITNLLSRKNPPKRTPHFLADALLAGDHALATAMNTGHQLAPTLRGLGPAHPARDLAWPLGTKATSATATMLQLTLVLAAYEAATNVDTWRHPTGGDQRFFRALQDWGYTLSPVEQLVLDPHADADNWPHLTPQNTEDSDEETEQQENEPDDDELDDVAEPDEDE